ncbi:MAG TPA: hypothetical protein VJJ52_04475 [Candidatus Nanoarchaeia archaeon]|nr:hypothetical protein [Candidatus Nanoarchaeia archaeon]
MNIRGGLSRVTLVAGLLMTFGNQATAQNTLEAKLSQNKTSKPDTEDYDFSSLYRALSLEENNVRLDPNSGKDPYGMAYKSLVLKFSEELVKLAGRYGLDISEMIDDASNEMLGGIGAFTFLDEIVLQYPSGNSSNDTVWVRLVFYPNDVVLENLWGNGNDNYLRIKMVKIPQPDNSIKFVPVSLPVNPDFPYQSDMQGYDFWQVYNRAKEIRKYNKSTHHYSYILDQFRHIKDFLFKRYGINPPVHDGNGDSLFAGGGLISASYYIDDQRMVLNVRDKPQATLEAVEIQPGLIKPKIVFPIGYKK